MNNRAAKKHGYVEEHRYFSWRSGLDRLEKEKKRESCLGKDRWEKKEQVGRGNGIDPGSVWQEKAAKLEKGQASTCFLFIPGRTSSDRIGVPSSSQNKRRTTREIGIVVDRWA